MLLTIIRKEVLTNLLSFRFAVSLLLCMVLIPVSAYVLKNDYKQELNDYNTRVMAYEKHLNTVKSINYVEPLIDRAPAILSVMFKRGAANRLIQADEALTAHFRTDTSNPISMLLPLFDMGAIMGVILSLMAILFGYDALVSEKEGGTLRLLLSNSVSRSQVLLGKWVGGYISLLLPLIISSIVGLLIVTLDPIVSLHGSDWLALGLIFLAAIIYVSIFFGLAYFVSAVSRSFAASALISLCVWLFIVLVVPNVSVYVAGKLRPMPSVREARNELRQLNRKLNEEHGKEIDEFMRKPHSKEEEARFLEKAFSEGGAIYLVLEGVIAGGTRIGNAFEQKANSQIDLAKRISAISPYACFTYLAGDLSGTGVQAEHDLTQKSRTLMSQFLRYILEEHRRNTRSLSSAEINRETDISNMPRLKYVELELSERFSASLIYFLLLAIFNVIVFMAAYVAFLRSAVR